MQIGFKKFFLYVINSKVQVIREDVHKNKMFFVCGKVNKYNVNFRHNLFYNRIPILIVIFLIFNV